MELNFFFSLAKFFQTIYNHFQVGMSYQILRENIKEATVYITFQQQRYVILVNPENKYTQDKLILWQPL